MGAENSTEIPLGKPIQNDIRINWESSESLNYQPTEGQAYCIKNNCLYTFGGVVCGDPSKDGMNGENETNELKCYNPETNTWKVLEQNGEVPSPRSGATFTCVNEKLYLFGGLSALQGWLNDLYVFSEDIKKWKKLKLDGNQPSPRDKLSSCTIGKNIYYFGGFGPVPDEALDIIDEEDEDDDEVHSIQQRQDAANFSWFNQVYKFDTENEVWSLEWSSSSPDNNPSPRAAHSMSVIDDNKFIIFGGRDSVARQNNVWTFCTQEKSWKQILASGQQPLSRSFHASVCVDNRLVIYGGRGNSNQHFSEVDILDTKTNEWYQAECTGAKPPAVGLHCLFVANNSVYLCGGSGGFNPATNTCTDYNDQVYSFSIDNIRNGGKVETGEENTAIPAKSGEGSIHHALGLQPN